MTRKTFYRKRMAFTIRLYEYYKGTPHESKWLGKSLRAGRPVSGKPLVDFENIDFCDHSYDAVWAFMEPVRKLIGMD